VATITIQKTKRVDLTKLGWPWRRTHKTYRPKRRHK